MGQERGSIVDRLVSIYSDVRGRTSDGEVYATQASEEKLAGVIEPRIPPWPSH